MNMLGYVEQTRPDWPWPVYKFIDPDDPWLSCTVVRTRRPDDWVWSASCGVGGVASGRCKRKRPAMYSAIDAMNEFKAKLARAEGKSS